MCAGATSTPAVTLLTTVFSARWCSLNLGRNGDSNLLYYPTPGFRALPSILTEQQSVQKSITTTSSTSSTSPCWRDKHDVLAAAGVKLRHHALLVTGVDNEGVRAWKITFQCLETVHSTPPNTFQASLRTALPPNTLQASPKTVFV